MSLTTSLDLLLKEIKDPYAQENWYRLKLYLETLSSGITTINQTIINAGDEAVWEKFSRSINASTTSIVDSIPLTSFDKIEYIISYKDIVTNRVRALKVSVVNDDTTIKEQVYAISGAPLDIDLTTKVTGPNYELEIVNNELNAVEMLFARLTLN